jgi:hypothetical protein
MGCPSRSVLKTPGAGIDLLAQAQLIEIEHPELLLAGMHIRGHYSGVSLATLTRTRHPGLPVLFVMDQPGDIKHMFDFEQPFAALTKPCQLAEIVAVAQRLVAEVEGERPSYGFV